MNLTQEILYELKSNYACRKRFTMPECKLPHSKEYIALLYLENLLQNVFGEEISLKCPESNIILNAYIDFKSIYFK